MLKFCSKNDHWNTFGYQTPLRRHRYHFTCLLYERRHRLRYYSRTKNSEAFIPYFRCLTWSFQCREVVDFTLLPPSGIASKTFKTGAVLSTRTTCPSQRYRCLLIRWKISMTPLKSHSLTSHWLRHSPLPTHRIGNFMRNLSLKTSLRRLMRNCYRPCLCTISKDGNDERLV